MYIAVATYQSGRPGSNRRPEPWQGSALPTALRPRGGEIYRRKAISAKVEIAYEAMLLWEEAIMGRINYCASVTRPEIRYFAM